MSFYHHPTAIIDEGAEIGDDTKIWHFCHVMSGARIGERCVLGQNVYVGGTAVIGDGCKVQNNVSVYDGVCLDDDVFVGPSAVFTNVRHPRAHVSRKDEYEPTRVGRGATIGANATIVCGTRLGEYAFVGAGSVVTKDVPAHALVVGNPARQLGWACQCGERLAGDGPTWQCDRCGTAYQKRSSSASSPDDNSAEAASCISGLVAFDA
ncbi:N-acetyltransferase [Persicimonas caeni]|uniref:N-acetyltransferase n=1 Tax=Persicimonas caeni TaxID=2292766 RepID=A0A4Y6PTZ8_PERCE|nr:acyltransferase [Persicimonas caeni]QDG51720.1 N-acetyltransferase [Persicimonas caeni]QED32941.1 N-acetyltransferase [Persicimonas caeni]